MTTRRKLALLGTLYLSQGLPYGFFTQALPVLLREQGLSLPAIGFTYLLVTPWALKFLWAPYVDRLCIPHIGRRRSWILPLQGSAIVVLALVSMTSPSESLPLVLCGILVLNLIAATQDIATDGLAVEVLSPGERGIGNGVQVAGYRVGMIIGGGALLIAFDHLGWPLTMLTMAVILLAASVPIARHREPSSRAALTTPLRSGPLRTFLRSPGVPLWLVVLVLYKSGDAFATGMLRPFLVDAGLDMEDIGWLLGAAGFTAGLLGALLGGWGTHKFGRERALIIFGIVQAVAVSAYIAPAAGIGSFAILAAITTFEHFAGGMATVALFTMMMDVCRSESEGSDYTLQASVVVIATGVASTISGLSAEAIGYTGHFALAGALCVVTLVLVARYLTRSYHQARAGLHDLSAS